MTQRARAWSRRTSSLSESSLYRDGPSTPVTTRSASAEKSTLCGSYGARSRETSSLTRTHVVPHSVRCHERRISISFRAFND